MDGAGQACTSLGCTREKIPFTSTRRERHQHRTARRRGGGRGGYRGWWCAAAGHHRRRGGRRPGGGAVLGGRQRRRGSLLAAHGVPRQLVVGPCTTTYVVGLSGSSCPPARLTYGWAKVLALKPGDHICIHSIVLRDHVRRSSPRRRRTSSRTCSST
jgi:hypothetical protein